MDQSVLLTPVFGKAESLYAFALENALEHQLFSRILNDRYGARIEQRPIIDLDPANFDDWLQMHALQHMSEAQAVGATVPPWLNNVNMDVQDAFYQWVGDHASLHQYFANLIGA